MKNTWKVRKLLNVFWDGLLDIVWVVTSLVTALVFTFSTGGMKFLFDGKQALHQDLTAVFGTPQKFDGSIDYSNVCVLTDDPNTIGVCKCYNEYEQK
jgi:hypothetical protein